MLDKSRLENGPWLKMLFYKDKTDDIKLVNIYDGKIDWILRSLIFLSTRLVAMQVTNLQPTL